MWLDVDEDIEEEGDLTIQPSLTNMSEPGDTEFEYFFPHCCVGVHDHVVEIASLLKQFIAFIIDTYFKASSKPNSNAWKYFRYAVAVYLEVILLVVLDPKLWDTRIWSKYLVRLHVSGALFVDMSTEE